MTDPTIYRSRKRPRAAGHLPTELLLEIVGRTDPATVVRCAATSKELRRHIADPAFHGCLRLRRSKCFIPSLLRGYLLEDRDEGLHLDSTSADATKLPSVGKCTPITARGGLVLVRRYDPEHDLCVYSPATGRSQALPPEPNFNGICVLLVRDGVGGAVGRPFQVLTVNSFFISGPLCSLQIQTFLSEKGTWGPLTDVPTPLMHGVTGLRRQSKHLVISDTVHWLCYSDKKYYVLKLHVREEAKVTVTKLPPSFHRACSFPTARPAQILLATDTVDGSPIVLVSNNQRILSWGGSKLTRKWKEKPQVVIENEALLPFTNESGLMQASLGRVQLEWFGEKSGVVLIKTSLRVPEWDGLTRWRTVPFYFWLDLGNKEIIGWSNGSWNVGSKSGVSCNVGCPYEIDLSSWVPTLCKTL
ncbi:hypothetical protein EJB05_02914, partial [Eragrostis curvula]